MFHEPRRLVRNAELAVELVSGKTLLRAVHQCERQHPLVQRDFAVFHDRADGNGERLGASVALIDARARGFALQLRDILDGAAMRADRPIRPMQLFQMLPCLVRVVVDRVGKARRHGLSSCRLFYAFLSSTSSI